MRNGVEEGEEEKIVEVAAYLHMVEEESRQWNPAADSKGKPRGKGCRPLWPVRLLLSPTGGKVWGDLAAGDGRLQEQTQLLSVDLVWGC